MEIVTDKRLKDGFVYEVGVLIQATTVEVVNKKRVTFPRSFATTSTYNPAQPDVCIDRCIRKSKFEKPNIDKITINYKQKLSPSNI